MIKQRNLKKADTISANITACLKFWLLKSILRYTCKHTVKFIQAFIPLFRLIHNFFLQNYLFQLR